MNIAELLSKAASERPDSTALIFEGRRFAFNELDRLTNRFANALRGFNVDVGGVVAIFLDSGPELVVGYLGALKAGIVPNVVNGFLKAEEVRHIVRDSRAAVLLTDPDRYEALASVVGDMGNPRVILTGQPGGTGSSFEDVVAASADHFDVLDLPPSTLASLLYTSGTTGQPKGVMLTHRNILANATHFSQIHYQADDRLLIAAPLFHCWGLINGVLATFAAGGTSILVRRFQTEPVLALIEEARPTILMCVPSMVNFMARSPSLGERDLSSLRSVLSAAAPMPLELIEILQRDWRVGYAESYGLTETSPVITTTHHTQMRPGSCGRAMGDTQLTVRDPGGRVLALGEVGELWASGTAIAPGYHGRPDATVEVFTTDGWFKTGDIARIDREGYVTIVDRLKDMINVGGEKVYPRDVEEVLHRHPAVADSAVIGVPDRDRGEVVKAYVVLKAGQECAADALLDFLRPKLASFKLPRSIEFVAVIPRSASGKALRRLLR